MDDMRRMCGGKDDEEGDTLDDILRRHNDFLDICLTECLLTNVGLLKVTGLDCEHSPPLLVSLALDYVTEWFVFCIVVRSGRVVCRPCFVSLDKF